jgi:DNA-binding transcriptional MerR regulator
MRGKRYNDEDKEKALALLATNNDIKGISKQLDIPERTLRDWKSVEMVKEEESDIAKYRMEKRKEFVDNSWRIIEKSVELGEKRINRALEHESELDELIELINGMSADEMPQQTKMALIAKIKTLQIQSIKDLSTFIGTLYDKAALAAGDSTANNNVTIAFEQSLLDIIKRKNE